MTEFCLWIGGNSDINHFQAWLSKNDPAPSSPDKMTSADTLQDRRGLPNSAGLSMIEVNLSCVKPPRFGAECVTAVVHIQQAAHAHCRPPASHSPSALRPCLTAPRLCCLTTRAFVRFSYSPCSSSSQGLCPYCLLCLDGTPCPSWLNSLFRSQIKPHFENKFSGSKPLFHASMKSCIPYPIALNHSFNVLSLSLFNGYHPKSTVSLLKM